MDAPQTITEQWMVVRTDATLTNHFFMEEGFADKSAAQGYINAILAKQRKPHGQDYEAYPYTPDTHRALVKRFKLPDHPKFS